MFEKNLQSGHAKSRNSLRLGPSYHLIPEMIKIHLDILRRLGSNPGRLRSKQALYPFLHYLSGCNLK